MEWVLAITAYVGAIALMSGVVGWVFDRRRCVVCGRHVSRRDWRAPKVWVREVMRWRPAHRGCVVPSDAAIERWVGGAR